MSGTIPASVAVLTRNSGLSLECALESVRDFAEIIVCDGGSTDDTLAIAERYGARVIAQDASFLDADGRLYDYGGARNQTLDAATHDWFFFLDSDEYVDAVLVESIRSVITRNLPGAYWVNRKYVRGGVVIEHATTYPNRQMRFFAKQSARRFIKNIHERIVLMPGVQAGVLDGTLYVPFDMTIGELRRKWRYQADVEAKRVGPMSLPAYAGAVFSYAKVSLLYLLRYARILLLGSGSRMPFLFEMERHVQHMRLSRVLLKNVTLRVQSRVI